MAVSVNTVIVSCFIVASLLSLHSCDQSISEDTLFDNGTSRNEENVTVESTPATRETDTTVYHRVTRQAENSNNGNGTGNGNKTESAFDYLYDFLLETDNKKMCSLMRETDVEPKLKSMGDFTLFVPSDEAMSLIPGSMSDELANDAQKRVEFVLSHVVPGNIFLRPMRPYQEITTSTANGTPIKISAYVDGFVVNGANVLNGDKLLGNGSCTMHFVDKVLYPPPSEDAVEYIDRNYKQMARLLKMSGLENKIQRNMVTCFVPTDDAFRAVPWSITQQLLTNRTLLKSVIENHIIPGNFYSLGLAGNQINSIAGEPLTFGKKRIQSRELILINSVPIVNPDQCVTNGVIHGINRVLLPKNLLEDCKCDRTNTYPTDTTTATTPAGPVYNPSSTTPTTLNDETSSNSVPGTTNTGQPNPFLRRATALSNSSENRNRFPNTDNTLSEAPYEASFTPTTTIASPSTTHATTTPTPIFFRATRRRLPPRNPITRGYDPRRTVPTRNRDSFFTELDPFSAVTDYNSQPTTVYYPFNPYYTGQGQNGTRYDSTPYDPTRRPTNTDYFSDDPNPSIASLFPTPNDRTRRPNFNTNTFDNPSDTSTPTTNTASTTFSPYVRRTYLTQNPGNLLSTRNTEASTSTYETPLESPAMTTRNRRRPIFESRTTTELPFWVTRTTRPGNTASNTYTNTNTNTNRNTNTNTNTNSDTNTPTPTRRTTRIINDNTEPSTEFFDSTRRPTAPSTGSTFDNRRGLSRGPNLRSPTRPKEEETSNNDFVTVTTRSPRTKPTTDSPSTTTTEDPLKTDPQTIDEIMDEPGLNLNGKPVSFNTFKDNLRRSGLTNLLSSDGPFTVFMPSDEAFKSLKPSTYNDIKRNPTKLRNMLLKHIAFVQIPPNALQNNFVVQTFSGDTLQITVETIGKRVMVNGIPIMAATSAQNGIIYVIGTVLPTEKEEENAGNALDELNKKPELSRFTKLLEKTRFRQILQGEKEFTILAPDNSAFEDLSPNVRRIIENDNKILDKMIGNHVIEGKYSSEQLAKIAFLPSMSGIQNMLRFTALPGSITVNGISTFIQFDIPAGNCVVHVTNRILIPEDIPLRITTTNSPVEEYDDSREPFISNESTGNEMENAEKNSKFLKALRRTTILDKLIESQREYTLIVPADKAIDKLPEKLKSALDTTPHRLKSLFNYHIIPQYVDFSGLENDDMLPSISGKPIRFNKYNNGSDLALSGATIDKVTTDGNVLLIFVDRVLYPPQGNIYQIIKRSPLLKTLTKLVENAKLDRELSQDGPFTLFAPNDDAFKKLSSNAMQRLTSSPDTSREFLLRHVVQPLIFTSAIPMGKRNTTDVTNATGERLKLQRLPDCVSVDGVTLSFADVTATNGVVHVIDHVL